MKTLCAAVACSVIVTGWLANAEARGKKAHAIAPSISSENFWQSDLEEANGVEPYAVGWVSWYGRGFHGRRTASGERYNMHELTCASRDLPFGTLLEVMNVENGEKVVVRVNDRGPFVKGRILDLSLAAAKQLGFLGRGSTKAELRLVPSYETVASR